MNEQLYIDTPTDAPLTEYGFDALETMERGEPVFICPDILTAQVFNAENVPAVAVDNWTLEHGEYLGGLQPVFVFCDDLFKERVSRAVDGACSLFAMNTSQNDIGEFLRGGGDLGQLYGESYTAAYYDHREATLPANDSGVIPLEGQAIPQADYPIDALGPIMGPITRSIISNSQVSAPLAAQSVLAVAALTAQPHADVKTPYFGAKPRPCSLFFLTIAESGERKSAANDAAMTPVMKYQKHLAEHYEHEIDMFRRDERGYQKLVSKAEAKAKNMTEMRQLVDEIGDPPQAPLSPIIVMNEPTIEGFLKSADTAHAGRAIITDEAGAFLGGHSMTSEKKQLTLTTLSKLWDSSAVVMSRVGRETPPVRDKRLTMHLMGQSVVVRPLLSDPLALGQGFLARFLTVSAAPRAGFRELKTRPTAEDYRALNEWTDHIYDIWLRRSPTFQSGSRNELKPLALDMDGDAYNAWAKFSEYVEKEQRPDGRYSEIKPFASKAAEQALRLAGVFTVIEKPGGTNRIDGETMARAVTLMRFYADEHLRLIEQASANPQLTSAAIMIEWIKANRDLFVYKNDLHRNGPNALRKDVAEVLKTLCDYGHIQPVKPRMINGSMRQNCYEVMV